MIRVYIIGKFAKVQFTCNKNNLVDTIKIYLKDTQEHNKAIVEVSEGKFVEIKSTTEANALAKIK